MQLPLGSIVRLMASDKEFMIYGYKQKRKLDGITYDYVSCLYPEGHINSGTNIFFNHKDIKEVIHIGFKSIGVSMQNPYSYKR